MEGRGWLLSLLLRTKPLYHGSLALSAYCQRIVVLTETGHTYRPAAGLQQEHHLEMCLAALSEAAGNSCPKIGVGVMTAVIQLFYYQVR
jgi:C6 transcription factor Pro1